MTARASGLSAHIRQHGDSVVRLSTLAAVARGVVDVAVRRASADNDVLLAELSRLEDRLTEIERRLTALEATV